MNERVGEALERAAELVAAAGTKGDRLGYGDALAGWADAVLVLAMDHGTTSMNCCDKCNAIRGFCDAMRGGSDEGRGACDG